MDMASITAAITGIKFAKDTVQTFVDYKVEEGSQAKVSAVLDKLAIAYESLFDMRDELFRLQSENERMRQDLKSRDDWETRKGQYRLVRTEAGAMVWAATFEPSHSICPVCFERREAQMLQPRGSILDCPACKASYPARILRDIPMHVQTDFNAWDTGR